MAPTKAEIAAELKQAREEIAALRELLAVVRAATDVPSNRHPGDYEKRKNLKADRLAQIAAWSKVEDRQDAESIARRARSFREHTEPARYETCCGEWVITGDGPGEYFLCKLDIGHDGDCAPELPAPDNDGPDPCPAVNPSTGEPCVLDTDHIGDISHRDRYGFQWAEPLFQDEPVEVIAPTETGIDAETVIRTLNGPPLGELLRGHNRLPVMDTGEGM